MQFEYFRRHDVAQLASFGYPGEFLFSDHGDTPPLRAVPAAPQAVDLLVRMWESPESSRRVWGELVSRAVPESTVAQLLDTVRFVVKEAACEAHVTLAKLTSRIAARSSS